MTTTPNRNYPIPDPALAIHPAVRDLAIAIDADVTTLAVGGDVIGPSSAVNNRIAVFDGTTGKLIKDGGSTIADIVAGSGGLVTSVFGRTGAIVAATNDYTFAQIDKTTSSLADLTTRSAGDLSSGTLPDARFPATLPAISGVNLTNLNATNLASGTVSAGRMPALTGDVTTSVGSVATTIANNAVSLAKLADIATASFLGRNTAGTGDPEVLSVATAKTMLGITGTNSGDVTLAGENYLSIAGQVITANAVNLSGTNVTSTLTANKGGTGQASYTVGDLLYASGTTTLSKLAGVATGNALISGGVGAAPSWGKIDLTTHISNTLPAANGGTGQSSYAVGDLLYASTTSALSKLADVATGNVLISGGIGVAPAWGKVGLTTHISGILGSANGGTGSAFFGVAGPTVLRTYTFPDANSTIARTDTGQTFTGTNNFQHLLPVTTDTYDLGSSTKLWRKGWLSELDAVLFAQNTASVLGGWLIIGKNEGLIPVGQDVGTGDTSIDFGQAMTLNDFVVFRAALQVEYVQIGSLVSGTRYNVTRNVDGSGANAWVAGTVYLVLGNTGNGRIELNSNSTPRISLITQGSAYNTQTEMLRIGDLNGSWNVSSETYGFAVGQYGVAGKSSLRIDDSGIHFYNNITERIRLLADGSGFLANTSISWDTSGNLTVAGNASIAGWTVNATSILSGSGATTVAMDSGGTNPAFYAGSATPGSAPFRVTNAGALTATNATITGAITATSGSFTGSITSSAGTIAGWTIGSNAITKNEVKLAAGANLTAAAGTGECWIGKSATDGPYYGMFLKGTTSALINIIAGQASIGTAGRPYFQMGDGTRTRVIIGELNTTLWDGVATNSMGMKIWDSAGSLLVHFSDVANVISGWTISTTKITSTGIDILSGASAALSFGSTPPTSASAGTGIWLDRTGLYGLASSVVQAKLDAATGAIVAGAGKVTLDSSGLTIVGENSSLSRIKWTHATTNDTSISAYNNGGTAFFDTRVSGSGSTNPAIYQLLATTQSGSSGINLSLVNHPETPACWAYLNGVSFKGLQIGESLSGNVPTTSTVLELVSTTGAFLPPKMTTTQKNALTPTDGMIVYDTTIGALNYRKAGAWVSI